jgi:putative sigma-54 modulation protein
MNMNVKGRHMAVTPPIHDYAEEKIGRASKILDQDTMTVEVELYVEKNPSIENNQVAEVTVWTKRGPVIRAKEASSDMYAAIDLVSDKLERQFRKYKGKMDDRHRGKKHAPQPPPLPPIEELVPLPDEDGSIVKTKEVELQPMTHEEAILQLELLGHDFFVFESSERANLVSVLYRRNDGDFGLIQPMS